MYYVSSTNQYLQNGVAFELEGIQYPANWLTLASADEKIALGLQEVVTIGSRPDDRYYWITEDLHEATRTYVATPKDLVMLQTQSARIIDQQAYSLLLPSDWMVVRASESGVAVPDAWKTWRAAVRTVASRTRTALAAVTTVEQLISVMTDVVWPPNPDEATKTI